MTLFNDTYLGKSRIGAWAALMNGLDERFSHVSALSVERADRSASA